MRSKQELVGLTSMVHFKALQSINLCKILHKL